MISSYVIHNDKKVLVPPHLRIYTKLALWNMYDRGKYWWDVITRQNKSLPFEYLNEFHQYLSIELFDISSYSLEQKTLLQMKGLI